jgi:ribonuclease D
MIEVALAAPRSADALANLRAFPRGMERSRSGADILAAVERGLARDPATLPKIERERRSGGSTGATVELLKVLLGAAAGSGLMFLLGVAAGWARSPGAGQD